DPAEAGDGGIVEDRALVRRRVARDIVNPVVAKQRKTVAPAAKPMPAASPSLHKGLSACLPLQNESCRLAGHYAARSNRHPVAVEFVVLVVAALARAEIGEVMDELDCRDPFDHLEPQLILAAQP